MSSAAPTGRGLAAVDREGFAAFVLRMRAAGIGDRALIEAVEATPRRDFIDPQHHAAAWSGRMIPLDCGETIEGLDQQASVLAGLDIEPSHRVLEVGTGSGYTAAVMGEMAKRVYTVERFARLHQAAQGRLRALGRDNVIASRGDASAGSADGPFDRIVAWAAFDAVPRPFIDQLVSGGMMICPIGEAGQRQTLVRLTKVGSRFEREDIGTARAQPIVAGLSLAL